MVNQNSYPKVLDAIELISGKIKFKTLSIQKLYCVRYNHIIWRGMDNSNIILQFFFKKFIFCLFDWMGYHMNACIFYLHLGDYINKGAKLWHGLFSNYLSKYHSKSTMSLHIIMCWSGFLKMMKPEIVWRILWFITLQNPLIYWIFHIHSVTWTPKGQKGCYTDYYNPFWS